MTTESPTITAVVVDASVVLKTVVAEPQSAAVIAAFARLPPRTPLLAPRIVELEVANGLLRRVRNGEVRGAEVPSKVPWSLKLVDIMVDPPGTVELALKHRLSAYDAQYLALTLDSGKGARLWTYDEKLGKAAAKEGILATPAELGL